MVEPLGMKTRIVALIVGLAALLAGCGGGGKGGGLTAVIVNPSIITMPAGSTQQFVASVVGSSDQKVDWSVNGGGGTITASGLYTAPSNAGTYVIRATSKRDSKVSGGATITVQGSSGSVSIVFKNSDMQPVIVPLSRFKVEAQVSGSADTGVEYTVESANGGTITSTGVWTAPGTAGNYVLVATSKADTTKFVKRTVTVSSDVLIKWTIKDKGDIIMRMRTDEAPATSANLVSLVNEKFYDGIVMHRYEPGFVIQFGDPLTKTLPLSDPSIGSGGPGYTIPFETNPLLHEKYAVAMARSQAMDSGGSQIYICLEPQPGLDGQYCVFGAVTSGFGTVDSLRKGDVITSAVTQPVTD